MGRRKKKLPVIEKLLIENIGAGGKSIARYEGMIVFVKNTIPGDIVDVQLTRKRKSYMEGYPVVFHLYSDNRSEPFCMHFGICGGCTWQHLPYQEQLNFKQKQVYDNLVRIGGVKEPDMEPIVASPAQTHYRNKLEFTFSASRWLSVEEIESGKILEERNALGFHIPGKYDKVLDIENCYLQPEPSNAIRNFIRDYAQKYGLEFFNLNRQEGMFRNLIIRNTIDGEFMIIISCFRNDTEPVEKLLSAMEAEFPEISSLYYVINSKANDTISDLDLVLFRGREYLVETMEDLHFRISPKSFFQTNSQQSYQLYRIVREYADLKGTEIVYDLYTGTGTIALFLARHCSKVVGIDFIDEAIADAERNSEANQIKNTEFIAGDIKELLNNQLILDHGKPDLVITDPPRNGMHKDVVQALINITPAKIIYVSCNPATQARDIKMLSSHYDVVKCRPVDMFPHTLHVENIVLMKRKP